MHRPLAEIEEEIRHQDRPETERLIDLLLLEIDGEADTALDAKWLADVQGADGDKVARKPESEGSQK